MLFCAVPAASHKPRYRHHERSTSYQWVKSLDLTEKPIVQEHCPRSPVLRFMAMCVCVCVRVCSPDEQALEFMQRQKHPAAAATGYLSFRINAWLAVSQFSAIRVISNG